MKLIIAGDIVTNSQEINTFCKNSIVCEELEEEIKKADFSIINLECPVAQVSDGKIKKEGPALRTDTETLEYIKGIGFNAVTLANNHFFDYGENGVANTIETLDGKEVSYVGGGVGERISKPLIVGDMAILNYCESEFSVINPQCGSNPLSPIKAYYDVNHLKDEGFRSIVIIVHGGHEHYRLPSPRMQDLYRYLIDLGATAVINHHQHCHSGYEKYKGGMIFYGLGNFFFKWNGKPSRKPKYWGKGFFLELSIDNGSIENFRLHPYRQCENGHLSVEREDKDCFERDLEELNNIINNREQLETSYTEFCSSRRSTVLSWFMPYSNIILSALARRGFLPSFLSEKKKTLLQNVIRCESHRDICLASLE